MNLGFYWLFVIFFFFFLQPNSLLLLSERVEYPNTVVKNPHTQKMIASKPSAKDRTCNLNRRELKAVLHVSRSQRRLWILYKYISRSRSDVRAFASGSSRLASLHIVYTLDYYITNNGVVYFPLIFGQWIGHSEFSDRDENTEETWQFYPFVMSLWCLWWCGTQW